MRRCSAETWTRWRGLICEQGQSGQSVAAFCRDRGVRGSMFYKWKNRLEENDGAQFVEVKVVACGEAVRQGRRAVGRLRSGSIKAAALRLSPDSTRITCGHC